jgi:hypothetical protein
MAVALGLLATLEVSTPLWVVCSYIFLIGAGLGLVMQIVVLIVQNSVSRNEIGTATSSNNFFREIGATLGIATVGSLFSGRLTDRLAELLAGSPTPLGSSTSSLTPQLVHQLPASLQSGVVAAYADSLTPIMGWLVPLFLVGAMLALLIREVPLDVTDAPAH